MIETTEDPIDNHMRHFEGIQIVIKRFKKPQKKIETNFMTILGMAELLKTERSRPSPPVTLLECFFHRKVQRLRR